MTENRAVATQEWPYIPDSAFLYFPTGEEVRIGEKEKQWRKIFENNQQYQPYELEELNKLEAKLIEKRTQIDPWFDRANKLRFLQANKFKVSNTIDAMVEYTKWRATSFPVTITPQIQLMLNSGAFYFCGRDNKYRPIIIVDIGKFNPDDVDIIPSTLVVLMEFMINNLLIEGQVENYILIMNLEEFSFSLRSVVMKILGFTSNSYRGRLFVSYLLSTPTALSWSWETLASNFVSQNTLKKIKITKNKVNEEMWSHISKDIIEAKYGGNMPNFAGGYWPPSKQLMLFEDLAVQKENGLITPSTYEMYYQNGKLNATKVHQGHAGLNKPPPAPIEENAYTLQAIPAGSAIKDEEKDRSSHKKPQGAAGYFENTGQIEQNVTHTPVKSPTSVNRQRRSQYSQFTNSANKQSRIKMSIRTETSFIKDTRSIITFFQAEPFKRICGELPSHTPS